LVIKVDKAKMVELVERAVELTNKEPQYRIPWIVFDRDQVKGLDETFRWQKRIRSMSAGRISALKYGCLLILEKCR